jgi:hypothetical protein
MQINIPYFTLRLLTVASYFLPFIFFLFTCAGSESSKDAFNKEDAITNEKNKNTQNLSDITLLISSMTKDSVFENTSDYNIALTSLKEKIEQTFYNSDNLNNLSENGIVDNIIYPTNYSLSGIGSVFFHKNLIGKITMGISLFLSLITLVFWFIIRKKYLGIYIILLNLIAVLIFIIDGLIAHIDLQYGVYVLVFLLITQVLTEMQSAKSIKTDHSKPLESFKTDSV